MKLKWIKHHKCSWKRYRKYEFQSAEVCCKTPLMRPKRNNKSSWWLQNCLCSFELDFFIRQIGTSSLMVFTILGSCYHFQWLALSIESLILAPSARRVPYLDFNKTQTDSTPRTLLVSQFSCRKCTRVVYQCNLIKMYDWKI